MIGKMDDDDDDENDAGDHSGDADYVKMMKMKMMHHDGDDHANLR
jgi:hypothetical protein